MLTVMQAPLFDSFAFDPFPLLVDCMCSAEAGIGGRYIVQALLIALMVAEFDERLEPVFLIKVGTKKGLGSARQMSSTTACANGFECFGFIFVP
jgi:hypothetical protein